MKSSVQFSNLLLSEHWCINESVRQSLVDRFLKHVATPLNAKGMNDEDEEEQEGQDTSNDSNDDSVSEDIQYFANGKGALVCIEGILGKKISPLQDLFGFVDVDYISLVLDAVSEDDNIESVIIYYDTPGGTVTGIPELAEQVNELSKSKDVYAYTDTMAGSCGYWLMSQSDTIYISKSAQVGGVGVFNSVVHDPEVSKNLTFITDAEFKGIGQTPVTDKQKAYLTGQVAVVGEMFRSDIKAMRPDIQDADLQGQMFIGNQAVIAGFADGICNSVYDLIELLSEQYEDDDSSLDEVDNNQ